MNLPNKLTLLRVFMIPLFLIFFLCESIPGHFMWSFATFVTASLTDMLDGHIARKHNLVTDFGKLMDPLADKLLTMSAFICLLSGVQWGSTGKTVCLIVILSREFIVTALRQLAVDKGIVIAADKWGKLKTISQMVWISMVLLGLGLSFSKIPLWSQAADILFIVMIVLTVFSGFNYIWKNRHLFADA